MSNLIVRSLTGIVFVILLAGSLLVNEITFVLIFGLLILYGMWEFYHLLRLSDAEPLKYLGMSSGILLFIFNYLIRKNLVSPTIFLVFIPILLVIYLTEMIKDKQSPFRNIAETLLGIIYVAWPLSLFPFIVLPGDGGTYTWHFAIVFFIIIWCYDTGAYLTGMAIGRTPLWSRVSPKKTWEGAIGGAIIAMLVSWFISRFFTELSSMEWIIAAFLIVVTGTIGDLFESVLKRSLNIKDSGTIFPGHGGVLDRFDSVLLATPFYFAWLELIK